MGIDVFGPHIKWVLLLCLKTHLQTSSDSAHLSRKGRPYPQGLQLLPLAVPDVTSQSTLPALGRWYQATMANTPVCRLKRLRKRFTAEKPC